MPFKLKKIFLFKYSNNILDGEKECGYYLIFTRHVSDSVRSQGYVYFYRKKIFKQKMLYLTSLFNVYVTGNLLMEPSDE